MNGTRMLTLYMGAFLLCVVGGCDSRQQAPPTSSSTDQLEQCIASMLSDRAAKHSPSARLEHRQLLVAFPLNQNGDAAGIRSAANLDVAAVLKCIAGTSLDYDSALIVGKGIVRDDFGNGTMTEAVRAEYKRSTIGRINFAGFDSQKALAIRDGGPGFAVK